MKTVLLNVIDVQEVINNIRNEMLNRKFHSEFCDIELNILENMLTYKNKLNIKLTQNLRNNAPELINYISPLDTYKEVIFNAWGVDSNAIFIRSRKREYVIYRHSFFYLCRLCLGNLVSLSDIGKYANGLDHTTIIHSCNSIQDLIDIGDKQITSLIIKGLQALEQNDLAYFGVEEQKK